MKRLGKVLRIGVAVLAGIFALWYVVGLVRYRDFAWEWRACDDVHYYPDDDGDGKYVDPFGFVHKSELREPHDACDLTPGTTVFIDHATGRYSEDYDCFLLVEKRGRNSITSEPVDQWDTRLIDCAAYYNDGEHVPEDESESEL
jgi:hypothetical protein